MKRTLENCQVVKRLLRSLGKPRQVDGRCTGYADGNGDPYSKCQRCKLYELHEEEIHDC